MKKLTAGIFTVLMGLVSVNAADAAVASKGYVDSKFFTKDAQAEHVAAQKAIDDAQDVNINQNTADIATLNGDDTVAGSVKKQIKDATDTITNAYKAADTETLNSAKTYTNEEIAKINSADNGILKQAKDYTDAEVKELADGAVATNAAAIAAINDGTTGVLATAKKYADDQDAAQTATITTAYQAADTATLDSAKTYTNEEIAKINSADNGILKQAKDYTDGQIEALDLQAISRVPAECGTKGNYCVLTTNGTKFVWEVIVREDTTLDQGDTGFYGDSPATESTVTQ